MDRLSQVIKNEANVGRWKTVVVASKHYHISHSLFADDIILFREASVFQAKIILEVLKFFGVASAQELSKDKSIIYFSKVVPSHTRKEISRWLGIAEMK